MEKFPCLQVFIHSIFAARVGKKGYSVLISPFLVFFHFQTRLACMTFLFIQLPCSLSLLLFIWSILNCVSRMLWIFQIVWFRDQVWLQKNWFNGMWFLWDFCLREKYYTFLAHEWKRSVLTNKLLVFVTAYSSQGRKASSFRTMACFTLYQSF